MGSTGSLVSGDDGGPKNEKINLAGGRNIPQCYRGKIRFSRQTRARRYTRHTAARATARTVRGVLPGTLDFTKKGGVLSSPDAVLLQRITNGYQSPGSPMAMPPKGGDSSLTEEQIEDVVSYIKHVFGT